uniref:Uncharacterized protein n=1 Tax=Panagrolaimus davidi TaxID=227884 RepID=A0A914QQL8_9BILA
MKISAITIVILLFTICELSLQAPTYVFKSDNFENDEIETFMKNRREIDVDVAEEGEAKAAAQNPVNDNDEGINLVKHRSKRCLKCETICTQWFQPCQIQCHFQNSPCY